MKLAAACCVAMFSLSAFAQAVGTPPPPPPPSSPPADERGVTLASHEEAKAQRHSKYSAGVGGPLLIFGEVVSGLVLGAMLGGAYQRGTTDNSDLYLGAVAGGFLLGTIAAMYQYQIPVGRGTAGLTFLGSIVGALMGGG